VNTADAWRQTGIRGPGSVYAAFLMPSPQFESLLAMLRARPVNDDATVEEQRRHFDLVASLFGPAEDVRFQKVDAGGVMAEWVFPPNAGPCNTMFYLHGGAYTIGSPVTHRGIVSMLARAADARALSVDYRLAPEHPFPAAVDDALAAYRWLLGSGVSPSAVAVAGDSAGGGLALALLLALRDAGGPLPACAVVLSPWTDLAGTGQSLLSRAAADPILSPRLLHRSAGAYLQGADPRHPLASPLYADLCGLPPLLVHAADADIIRDDAVRFARRAEAAGVDVTLKIAPDMVHVWHYFASVIPEGREAIGEVGAFLRSRIK
jgi:acetyl esterase/lipase